MVAANFVKNLSEEIYLKVVKNKIRRVIVAKNSINEAQICKIKYKKNDLYSTKMCSDIQVV